MLLRKLYVLLAVLPIFLVVGGCAGGKKKVKSPTPEAAIDASNPYGKAYDLIADRDYDGAIKAATTVMEAAGKSVEGLTVRGISYAKANKPHEAFDDLIEAVRIERNFDTLMNVGNALRMFGFCDRASDAYRQALELEPSSSEAVINLASSYLCLGNVEEADLTFQRSFENFPRDAVAYTNMAILKDIQKSPEEAIKAARKAIEIDQEYTPAYQTLYRACSAAGDQQCAREAKEKQKSLVGKKFRSRKKSRN